MKQLQAWIPSWEDIRNEEVLKRTLEAQIELRRLEEERKLLTNRQSEAELELKRMGEPEAGVRAHKTVGRWWGGMFLLTAVVVILTAWWSVNWYLSLSWEKALLALTLFVLPLIGWMAFLTAAGERVLRRDLWKAWVILGLVIVVCSVAATVALAVGRMAGTALDEERRQTSAIQAQTDDLIAVSETPPQDAAGVVKRLLRIVTMISVALLGIAGELAAGLAFHEYMRQMTVVWTVWPFYEEQHSLKERLTENARRQEEVRRWPQLLAATVTIAGMRHEAEAARLRSEAARDAELHEERRNSLPRLVKWVLLWIGVGIALLALPCAFAVGQELRPDLTVALLDLSTSVQPDHEFSKNLRAVEGLIERMNADGSRLVVLGMTEASFAHSNLFVTTSPKEGGRFGEYLRDWRTRAMKNWRKAASTLKPSAKGSDLFGGLARASIELGDAAGARKRLIVLSDMRQFGRGYNFERPIVAPAKALEATQGQGLIPRLDGVEVWVLGAHTVGIDERHWDGLRVFWAEYFRRAGATLNAFSPNRHWQGR